MPHTCTAARPFDLITTPVPSLSPCPTPVLPQPAVCAAGGLQPRGGQARVPGACRDGPRGGASRGRDRIPPEVGCKGHAGGAQGGAVVRGGRGRAPARRSASLVGSMRDACREARALPPSTPIPAPPPASLAPPSAPPSWQDSVVEDVFGAVLQSTLTCARCGRVSHCFDPTYALALPLPARREPVALEVGAFGKGVACFPLIKKGLQRMGQPGGSLLQVSACAHPACAAAVGGATQAVMAGSVRVGGLPPRQRPAS